MQGNQILGRKQICKKREEHVWDATGQHYTSLLILSVRFFKNKQPNKISYSDVAYVAEEVLTYSLEQNRWEDLEKI